MKNSLWCEVGVPSGLGGALGVVLAISTGLPWWVGLLCGSLIAAITHQPREAWGTIGKVLVTKTGISGGQFWLLVSASLYLTALFLIVSTLGLLLLSTAPNPTYDFFFGGKLLLLLSIMFLASVQISKPWRFYERSEAGPQDIYWLLPLSRLIGLIMGSRVRAWCKEIWEGDNNSSSQIEYITRHEDGGYFIEYITRYEDGSYFKARSALRELFGFLIALLCPLVIAILTPIALVVVVADILLTAILALGTNKRIAIMGGSLIGSLTGYIGHALHLYDSLAFATILGAAVGFCAGPLLHLAQVCIAEKFRLATLQALSKSI